MRLKERKMERNTFRAKHIHAMDSNEHLNGTISTIKALRANF